MTIGYAFGVRDDGMCCAIYLLPGDHECGNPLSCVARLVRQMWHVWTWDLRGWRVVHLVDAAATGEGGAGAGRVSDARCCRDPRSDGRDCNEARIRHGIRPIVKRWQYRRRLKIDRDRDVRRSAGRDLRATETGACGDERRDDETLARLTASATVEESRRAKTRYLVRYST